jgi:probable rRNA maturation factor
MAATKTKRPAARLPAIDVVILAAGWNKALPNAAALSRRAARAALAAVPRRRPVGTIAIALADDDALRELNHQFRGKNMPTNVLSFPAGPSDHLGPDQLGDIALALQTLKREAAEQGKTLAQHLIHLVVHGTLHLLGHDHEQPAPAKRMEGLERKVLAGLGLPDPYLLPILPKKRTKTIA